MMIHLAIFARLFRTCFADANTTVVLPCIDPLIRRGDVSPETRMFKRFLRAEPLQVYNSRAVASKRLYDPTRVG